MLDLHINACYTCFCEDCMENRKGYYILSQIESKELMEKGMELIHEIEKGE